MSELALYPLELEILTAHSGDVQEPKLYEAQGYLIIDAENGKNKKDLVSGRLAIIDE